MAEIILETKNNSLTIKIPLTSQGKFRCKNRSTSTEYGNGFAPKTTEFTQDAYVEWQIGYDTKISDADKKTTSLKEYTFIGANNSEKYLYELSEILWHLCKIGLITLEQINSLYNEILNYGVFLQENFQIQMSTIGPETINNKKTTKSIITLPTFTFDEGINNEIFTEISIQKQQYATGVQPMLYVIIPVLAFDNGISIIGKTSTEITHGIYTISTKERANLFLKIMSYFGFCSEKHQHDVLEILKIIKEKAFI